MLERQASALVRSRLRKFPAVALVGPRQCGKTTLARALGGTYYDLEQPSERVRLDLAWDELVARKSLLVLDEAQSWPEVFVRLRGAIDARRKWNGRFLLLGSVSPSLMQHVSESLAGRLALVELSGLALGEVGDNRIDRLWRYGGFPDGGVLRGGAFPAWQLSYLSLLAQRDLPSWGLPAKPTMTDNLLRMSAALHGQVLNASKLGQSLGLSYHTVQSYLSYLQGAYLVRVLPPYEANLKKRLVKAPRVYVRDSGLLHALLGLGARDELTAQPWVGASWEGFVIEQILIQRMNRAQATQAFFFRSHDGHEVDLVLEAGNRRELIEIKLTSAPSPEDWARLDACAKLLGGTRQVMLSRVKTPQLAKTRWSTNLADYLRRSAAESRAAGA